MKPKPPPTSFTPEQKEGVYRAIYQRRDMRHFIDQPIAVELLEKIIAAAHAAPSVGMMQPWRIIRISDKTCRHSLHQLVEQERKNTAGAMGKRSDEFMKLKVEGITECAELLVIALADKREAHIFGRRTMPEMDLASVACAIQNMWLVARAEGLGMGWVSLFEPEALKKLLLMPAGSQPVAIICLGHVEEFYQQPMLQQEGWATPLPLEKIVMENQWRTDDIE